MKTFNVIEYLKKEQFDIDEYLLMIGRAELLSREEVQALVEKAQQGDEEAMNLLLCSSKNASEAGVDLSMEPYSDSTLHILLNSSVV